MYAGVDGTVAISFLLAFQTIHSASQVTEREGRQLAEEHGMAYFETTSANGAGGSEAIQWICDQSVNHVLEQRKKLGLE